MFKAVVFDIDGTLTKDNSWTRLTTMLGGSVEEHLGVYRKWSKGEMDIVESNKLVIKIWSKDCVPSYDQVLSIFEKVPFREDAKEVVSYLKNKGYKVCMMTSSSGMYAKIISEKLGIEDYFAIAELVWNENKELIDIDTTYKDKERKMELLEQYCLKNNLKIKECVPVGDSSNDIGLFEMTGNGIAVRTEFEAKQLEGVAWKIVDNLGELKNIL